MKWMSKTMILYYFLIAIGIIFIWLTISDNIGNSNMTITTPEVGEKNAFTKERQIQFTDEVNPNSEKITVFWEFWFDGRIVGDGESEPLYFDEVKNYHEKMKTWANEKIIQLSNLKTDE